LSDCYGGDTEDTVSSDHLSTKPAPIRDEIRKVERNQEK